MLLFLSLQFLPGCKKLPFPLPYGASTLPPSLWDEQPLFPAGPGRPHSERAEAGGVWQSALLASHRTWVLARGGPSQGQSYWGCSWALAGSPASWARCGGISELSPCALSLCRSVPASVFWPYSGPRKGPGRLSRQGRMLRLDAGSWEGLVVACLPQMRRTQHVSCERLRSLLSKEYAGWGG